MRRRRLTSFFLSRMFYCFACSQASTYILARLVQLTTNCHDDDSQQLLLDYNNSRRLVLVDDMLTGVCSTADDDEASNPSDGQRDQERPVCIVRGQPVAKRVLGGDEKQGQEYRRRIGQTATYV